MLSSNWAINIGSYFKIILNVLGSYPSRFFWYRLAVSWLTYLNVIKFAIFLTLAWIANAQSNCKCAKQADRDSLKSSRIFDRPQVGLCNKIIAFIFLKKNLVMLSIDSCANLGFTRATWYSPQAFPHNWSSIAPFIVYPNFKQVL